MKQSVLQRKCILPWSNMLGKAHANRRHSHSLQFPRTQHNWTVYIYSSLTLLYSRRVFYYVVRVWNVLWEWTNAFPCLASFWTVGYLTDGPREVHWALAKTNLSLRDLIGGMVKHPWIAIDYFIGYIIRMKKRIGITMCCQREHKIDLRTSS